MHSSTATITFTKFHPQPGGAMKAESFTLTAFGVKTLNEKLEEVEESVTQLKNKNLTDSYTLPLGRLVLLTISPSVQCVGIRQFFRPKGNPALMLPSKFAGAGTALKLGEFENLKVIWGDLLSRVETNHISTCPHEDGEQSCSFCFY